MKDRGYAAQAGDEARMTLTPHPATSPAEAPLPPAVPDSALHSPAASQPEEAVLADHVLEKRAVRGHHRLSASRGFARRSRLVRYLAIGYTLLIVYASLYPFTGWRDSPDGPFDFLFAAWPRFHSSSDVILNVIGYVPFGLLAALALLPAVGAAGAGLLSTAAGTVLSVLMEAIQLYISSRVASNLDVLTNGVGAMVGALLAITVGERWVLSGNLYRLRQRAFLPGAAVDIGFVVLLLWLFTQLNPEVWLFGNGDLRAYLSLHSAAMFQPDFHRWIETLVTASNLAGVCLLTSVLGKERYGMAGPLLTLLSLALALKTAAGLTLFRPGDAGLWITPGAMLGIPGGVAAYLLLRRLPRSGMAIAACLLFAAGAVLVNVAPENPYLEASVRVWRHGHFLSFSGVTQLVGALWPAIACSYLLWLVRLPSARVTAA
jgi:VanZ family protein